MVFDYGKSEIGQPLLYNNSVDGAEVQVNPKVNHGLRLYLVRFYHCFNCMEE